VERIERALNDLGRAVKGSRVVILGVSYKAGIGDVRESPALKIINRLQKLGADVVYHDPYVAALPSFGLSSTGLEDALLGADLAVIVTAHPDVDHFALAERLPLVDLRGATRTSRVAVPALVSLNEEEEAA
jgi:UDP-N-acetyl-D-glucosamine dehydrogenase